MMDSTSSSAVLRAVAHIYGAANEAAVLFDAAAVARDLLQANGAEAGSGALLELCGDPGEDGLTAASGKVRLRVSGARNPDCDLLDAIAASASDALDRVRTDARQRALIESSTDGFVLLDANGGILLTGPSVLGYGRGECDGRNGLDFVHPEDRQTVRSVVAAVLSDPTKPVSVQYRARHAEGSWRWMEGVCKNLLAEPNVGALVVNYRDITERKRLEEQFRQAQKMEALGSLAGGVAHDFNNLLMIISGYSQILLEDLAESESQRTSVEEILKAANHAAALTSQLLAFSRRHTSQARTVDLNHLVGSMDKMLRRVIGEHIQLSTGLSPDLAAIKADPGQIEQVILNLAVNARDAMPNGGALRIETRNIQVGQLTRSSLNAGDYVLISIRDTGHGMDAATKSRLFEPFFTTKEKGKGTGLGLSTVYGIVKQLGGEVFVTSEVGRGTTFDVYIPGAAHADEKSAAGIPAEPEQSRSETILLVEDEDGVRRLIREMLEKQGYTVIEAGDGRQALRAAEQHPGNIDLLLTDVVMPLMNGRELAERLAPTRAGLRVLYMSGYTDDVIAYHGVRERSAEEFLQKPFTAGVLIARVHAILDRGASAAAAG